MHEVRRQESRRCEYLRLRREPHQASVVVEEAAGLLDQPLHVRVQADGRAFLDDVLKNRTREHRDLAGALVVPAEVHKAAAELLAVYDDAGGIVYGDVVLQGEYVSPALHDIGGLDDRPRLAVLLLLDLGQACVHPGTGAHAGFTQIVPDRGRGGSGQGDGRFCFDLCYHRFRGCGGLRDRGVLFLDRIIQVLELGADPQAQSDVQLDELLDAVLSFLDCVAELPSMAPGVPDSLGVVESGVALLPLLGG